MKRVGLIFLGVIVAATAAVFVASSPAQAAADPPGCPGGQAGPPTPTANYPCPNAGGSVVNGKYVAAGGDPLNSGNDYVCIALPVLNGQSQGHCKAGQAEIPNNQPGGAIIFYLKLILRLVNLLVGGIILLALVVAGIQYITSVGDPSRVKAAKGRVINATIALVLYLMMFAILNFLIPGGILT